MFGQIKEVMIMVLNAGKGRNIDYMRISVTDRCNFRCSYCMPKEGIECKPREEIMDYEDIMKIVKVAAEEGISTFRITGGEPLVRLGIEKLIEKISDLETCQEVTMTTNGYLLHEKAEVLVEAGLDRVNISLDTLIAEKFKEITGVDGLNQVLTGIETAQNMGLQPVKINVVVIKNLNDDEIHKFAEFARSKNLHVRFIEYMPFNEEKTGEKNFERKNLVPLATIKNKVKDEFNLNPTNIEGNGPAKTYSIGNTKATIGFISPLTHNICQSCNRLRLTADGFLRPCLSQQLELNLYENQKVKSRMEIRELIRHSARKKPVNNNFKADCSKRDRNMSQIGG